LFVFLIEGGEEQGEKTGKGKRKRKMKKIRKKKLPHPDLGGGLLVVALLFVFLMILLQI